jgi:hypothetical protein
MLTRCDNQLHHPTMFNVEAQSFIFNYELRSNDDISLLDTPNQHAAEYLKLWPSKTIEEESSHGELGLEESLTENQTMLEIQLSGVLFLSLFMTHKLIHHRLILSLRPTLCSDIVCVSYYAFHCLREIPRPECSENCQTPALTDTPHCFWSRDWLMGCNTRIWYPYTQFETIANHSS